MKAQDDARAKVPAVPETQYRSSKRKRRFNPLGFLAALAVAATLDAIGDPSIGDSTIGDPPDEVITARSYLCIREGSYGYVPKADPADESCFEVDLRRPPMP